MSWLLWGAVPLLAQPPQEELEKRYQEEQRAELDAYFDKLLDASYPQRAQAWKRDFSGVEAYERSVAPWRARFADYLGGLPYQAPEREIRVEQVRESASHTAYRVWIPAFDKVDVYGVLLIPDRTKFPGKRPAILALHGMEGTPELVCGLVEKTDYHNRFGLQAVEKGYVVFAPVMMNGAKKRDWLDRKAIMVGQRMQGLEQFKMIRAVDFLSTHPDVASDRIGVYGISWGGRTAMYAAALDRRLAACVVSGHFMESTQKMTKPSPFYTAYIEVDYNYPFFSRQATEFADADICSLICPRVLHIEQGRQDKVAYWKMAQEEFRIVQSWYEKLGLADRATFEIFEGGHYVAGLEAFAVLDKWLKPVR
ncbi:MAG: dienelactone hydrolase family protein [Planctomycetota bacterium]|nr:dienelactone hydrolase family protein [Planctomycetota bacterium]